MFFRAFQGNNRDNRPARHQRVPPASKPVIALFITRGAIVLQSLNNVKIDLSSAWRSGGRIVDSAVGLLPNFLLAAFVFILALIAARLAKAFVRRMAARRQRRQSIGILLGQLTQLTIAILGVLIALSIVAPSFHMVDLIKILGIGSVAIGFAFQNVLQNFLAGILLLLNEPFEIGDLISVTGMEGIVQDIQTRATVIATPEGRHIVIPNAVLFTNPVAVAAHSEKTAAKPGKGAAPQDQTKPSPERQLHSA
jgi:small conductance mechanosensitive channel